MEWLLWPGLGLLMFLILGTLAIYFDNKNSIPLGERATTGEWCFGFMFSLFLGPVIIAVAPLVLQDPRSVIHKQ